MATRRAFFVVPNQLHCAIVNLWSRPANFTRTRTQFPRRPRAAFLVHHSAHLLHSEHRPSLQVGGKQLYQRRRARENLRTRLSCLGPLHANRPHHSLVRLRCLESPPLGVASSAAFGRAPSAALENFVFMRRGKAPREQFIRFHGCSLARWDSAPYLLEGNSNGNG